MDEDQIKDAFQRVKYDIADMKQEAEFLRKNINETKDMMIEICELMKKLGEKVDNLFLVRDQKTSTHKDQNTAVQTHTSTDNHLFKPLKHQISPISTGNQGVPTDKQTNRQTNRQTLFTREIEQEPETIEGKQDPPEIVKQPDKTIEDAADILDSLDSIKKEIRLKFKRLTEQEFAVFSTLYQLDEESGPTDYKTLSNKLNLTESSIRDYIGRLIKKGIPVDKHKLNNKNIQLSIAKNLKKIASLPTILTLRDI